MFLKVMYESELIAWTIIAAMTLLFFFFSTSTDLPQEISVQQLHIYSMLLSSLDIYAWATCLLSLIQVFFSYSLFYSRTSIRQKPLFRPEAINYSLLLPSFFSSLLFLLFYFFIFCVPRSVFVRFHSCFYFSTTKNHRVRGWK